MSAILSVMGLYNFDSSLFDNFQVPASIDKQQLINDICLECAELEVIYPDFMVLKNAIGIWSSKMLRQWDDLSKTLEYKYNPIENYDRYEEYTDTSSGTGEGYRAGFNSDSLAKTDKSESSGSLNHTAHIHGNIGVTTAAQMIAGQRDIVRFTVQDTIIEDFKKRFCLLIY